MKKTLIVLLSVLIATISISFSVTLWQERTKINEKMKEYKSDNLNKQKTIEQYRIKELKNSQKQNNQTEESFDDELTEVLINNKELINELYTYTSTETRLENIKPYLTKDQYQKMFKTSADGHQEKIVSKLDSLNVYVLERKGQSVRTIVNEVTSATEINKTTMKQRIYVKISYEIQKGKWKAKEILFTAIPSQDLKMGES
ncbi:hypothetical protein WO71_14885 [Listeria monocytogenes]|uniref:hypothetical protein n=1 Tax=Listeria monocytogenes TaxID=1639 RepID=UPI0010B65903|nr:hypothetical protein [Listeria monocytogenes]EAC4362754.1 hypothetical protein [Listeria monocytogenes]EAC6453157.1 hypothetical protein [Listeria monocytogenes]EAD0623867.1 hypothetical protein [Listeria monocytogenes]EAD4817987.1 hypothetical protein [Listeria monocytogenes]EAD4952513.1 hypothetical protein [Listeria monocytogenes]